tara:strand:- start:987 stop:1118 length:132 start_codon:yes stop_codon:yes gene_type:complete
MTAEDYTENQKKLIQVKYPEKYEVLWGQGSSVETKKEDEPAAE